MRRNIKAVPLKKGKPMKTCALLMSTVLAAAAFADARPLMVGAPDGEGNISITIGGTGTGDQALIAAWANGDKGDDPLDWTEYADVGTVAAADTSKTFQIPAEWRAKSGAVRFFLMSGTPPYRTRYDYITRPRVSADGDLYINTGIVPDSTCDITVKVQSPDLTGSAMCPFGIQGSLFIFGTGTANSYWFDFLGAEATTIDKKIGPSNVNVFGEAPPQDSESHVFRLCAEGLFIDGYRHLVFDQSKITETTTSTISLFARSTGKQKDTVCSIFSATISTNGVPACDLVPVAAPSGKIQMWDRVTGGWKGPAGNKKDELAFVPGNDIGPYPPDCGIVESVSVVVSLGPEIVTSNPNRAERTVSVSLSSGHGTGLLFAVAGSTDAGTVYSSWPTNMFVAKVSADTDNVTATLPEEWWRSHCNVRFAWKAIAGEPFDYAVVNLDSDGTGQANVLTGWTPTTNTAMSVIAKAASNVCAFGIASYFFLFQNGNTIYWNFFGNSGNSGCDGAAFPAQYHEWSIGPDGASVDGNSLASFTGATEATLLVNITLPFRSNYQNQSIGKTGDVSVKGAKIWEGGILVRDFAPCVKDGVPQFYDNVRGGFYGSRTSTPFTAGDIVVDDGDFVSWSRTRELGGGFVMIIR